MHAVTAPARASQPQAHQCDGGSWHAWLCGPVSTGRVRIRRRRFAATETRCPYRRGRARVNAVTESKDRETVPERWNAAGPGSDMWMDAAQYPRFAAGTKLEGE